VRFSGFPFEWDMAYNNLPCTNVQAVIAPRGKSDKGNAQAGFCNAINNLKHFSNENKTNKSNANHADRSRGLPRR
jgi:hypothetical protein